MFRRDTIELAKSSGSVNTDPQDLQIALDITQQRLDLN